MTYFTRSFTHTFASAFFFFLFQLLLIFFPVKTNVTTLAFTCFITKPSSVPKIDLLSYGHWTQLVYESNTVSNSCIGYLNSRLRNPSIRDATRFLRRSITFFFIGVRLIWLWLTRFPCHSFVGFLWVIIFVNDRFSFLMFRHEIVGFQNKFVCFPMTPKNNWNLLIIRRLMEVSNNRLVLLSQCPLSTHRVLTFIQEDDFTNLVRLK